MVDARRERLEDLLAAMSESRAAVFAALRPLRGHEFQAVRRTFEELADAENFVGRVLSRVYDIEIWGSGPSSFGTPEEAASGLIDSRETVHWTLKPALDEHLDQVFKLSGGRDFSIGAALDELVRLDATAASAVAGHRT
jgi:hypothetical protein